MRIILVLICVLIVGCQTKTLIPAAKLASEDRITAESDLRSSKVSSALSAADYANDHNPDGPAKDATKRAIAVGLFWSGPATPSDREAFRQMVDLELKGKIDEARKIADAEKGKAAESDSRLKELKADLEKERIRAAAELQALKDKYENKLRSQRDRWVTGLTIGIGSIAILTGVVMLVLGGQFSAMYPWIGPRLAFATILGGMASVGTGIAINAIERALDRHPWIIYTGMGLAASAVLVAMVLAYSNHHHEKQN